MLFPHTDWVPFVNLRIQHTQYQRGGNLFCGVPLRNTPSLCQCCLFSDSGYVVRSESRYNVYPFIGTHSFGITSWFVVRRDRTSTLFPYILARELTVPERKKTRIAQAQAQRSEAEHRHLRAPKKEKHTRTRGFVDATILNYSSALQAPLFPTCDERPWLQIQRAEKVATDKAAEA